MRAGAGSRAAIARVNTPVPAAVSKTSRGSTRATRSARSRAYASKMRGTKNRSKISGIDPANSLSVAARALLRHMTFVRSALVYKSRRLATRIDNPPGGRKRPLEKGVAMSLSEKSRDKLTAVSTATLTTVLFKRGFRNTFIQGIHRLNPGGPAMVGPAYTLRYIPAREDLDHLGVFEGRSHPQR